MRPIDADELANTITRTLDTIEVLSQSQTGYVRGQKIGLRNARKMIVEAPTLDMQSVVHAHWVESEEGYFNCSNCHNDAMVELYENSQKLTLFCPNCGAKMDK